MSAADFLDSNVFVYLVDGDTPVKRAAARLIVDSGLKAGSAVTSYQVVQETLNVLTRKFKSQVGREDRDAFFREMLCPLWIVQPSAALYASASEIHDRHGYAFHDSLIVAAALEAGCKRLLSEDLQHGQRIGGLRIENPFR